jgi:hypothetical protein
MRWPWVSRATLEACEARLKWTEDQLRPTEDERRHVEAQLTGCLVREAQLNLRLEAAENDRRLLLDRIVQMTGQPPIYEKPGPVLLVQPEPKPVPESADTPEAVRQVTFDDVHRDARRAMANGTFTMPTTRRPN